MSGLWPRMKMLRQLRDLGRVLEVNRPLMLEVLHEEIYKLRRHRQQEYGNMTTIDCFASLDNRLLLRDSMHAWYVAKYGLKKEVLEPHPYDLFERYNIPAHNTMFAVFSRGDEFLPILWFIDIANTTPQWEVLESDRHLAIVGFSGFGFKD